MGQPLVIAYHLIWTIYGSWLPNDPRGSGSNSIASHAIAGLGELHHGRKKIQPAGWVIEQFYQRAREVLRFPVLPFDRHEIEIVAKAVSDAITELTYTCYACAIMPDHVHILIRKHKDPAEAMVANLQSSTRAAIVNSGGREPTHPVWTEGAWKVFLDHPDDVRRTIRYIENNPVKEGLPVQRWSFVKPYDGWPLHAGHSPNSPYAKALRSVGRYPG
jgi:REP element-mobilizing transposase RayT